MESISLDRQTLTVSHDGPIATIRFTQPKTLNAITLPFAIALTPALQSLSDNPTVRVVVLSGEGKAFMAGGDLLYLRNAEADQAARDAALLISQLNKSIEVITAMPIPIVASAHGAVAGAGLSLLLACDFAIAASDTRFVFAYTAIAASPDAGLSWTLPRVIGMRKAMQFAFLDQQIDASTALSFGIVNELAPPHELSAATSAMATKLARLPIHAFAQTKQLMLGSSNRSLGQQLRAECDAFTACARTSDFREGVDAFFARRQPRFTGDNS